MADIYIRENNIKKAIEIYLSLLNIFPYHTDLGIKGTYHSTVAALYFFNGNYIDTVKYTRMSQAVNEKETNYLYSAIANIKLKRYEEALKDIKFGLKFNNDLNNEFEKLNNKIIKLKNNDK